MKRLIIVLVLITFVICFVSPYSSIAIRKNSPDQQDQREELLSLMEKARKNYGIPALAVAVIKSNSILEQHVTGVREVRTDNKAQLGDRFHLGSNSKAITGFVAGKLVEQGKLDWDTKFFDLLPELKENARPEYHAMTLKDLLSHRAGIPPYSFGDAYKGVPPLKGSIHEKRVGFCRHVLKDKPEKMGRDGYSYSNAGYVIAATMLEEATGETWENLVTRMLGQDLHLGVYFGWPSQVAQNQPVGHIPGILVGKARLSLVPYEYENSYLDDQVIAPAGDINISLIDYSRYVQKNLRGIRGQDNYLSAETYNFLHFGLPEYSMGWRNKIKKGRTISTHDGSAGVFFCHTYMVKELDVAVVIMANTGAMDPKAVLGIYRLRKKILHLYS